MFRTDTSVGMLQAIALIATLAVLLWSVGLPALRFADAANLVQVSDTISDSAPSASSTHTIVYTSPTGVANGATTTIVFPGTFTIGSVDFTDIDVASTSDLTLAANCSGSEDASASFSGNTLQIVYCPGNGEFLSAGGTTTIQIGTNATFGTTGDNNIVNPGAEGSYEITIDAGASDSGATRVAIIDSVTVTASVDTIFTFAVSGTATGTTMSGESSTVASTDTAIPFGRLTAGAATSSAQLLTVNTNASNGYTVTVQVDSDLQSSTGATIDSFVNGSDTDTPVAWSTPSGTLNVPTTYGHWGVTSDDTSAGRGSEFSGGNNYIGVSSSSPHIVMGHTGPANGQGVGVGTTTVGYKIEISALQEAGDDYSAVLTYIATPTF